MKKPALALMAVAAVSLGLLAPSAEARGVAPSPTGPRAQVWVTTVDRSELMHQRTPVTFARVPSSQTTITVDPLRSYQVMDGFGASITDSSAAVLYQLSPAAREQTMRSLFDPARGIGLSFLRQPIGSSDFTAAANHYSLDDVPAGQTDFGLTRFSIAHDEARILPLLRRAKQLNPRLTVMASPWSPPPWMKTSQSFFGGQLTDDPAVYLAYARYLVKFVRAYAAAGVPIDYLSIQNEVQNRSPGGTPNTDMPVAQQLRVIALLGPLLREASPRTKILSYDHNWATHPADVESTPPGRSPETDYPYQVLADPAAKWIAGTAYHCHYGDPSAQSVLHDAFPHKGIWFTECSGSHGATDPPDKYFRDTLTWHARTLTVGTTRNWAKSVVTWNLALNSSGGPHNGGCDLCTPLVTVNDDATTTTNAEFYTIGHLSRFVKPGAVRIGSTSFGTTGWNGQIMDVAFRNPDGSTALVVHNENDDPRTFTVAVADQSFDYTLPGGALATFTWPASATLIPRLRQLSLDGASASAEPNNADAALAIDDDASTRWSSGQAQQPGQYLQVDLGSAQRFRRVAIDSGGYEGDYARAWKLEVSNDATHWKTAGTGVGTGQLTHVDIGPARARYLRLSATGAVGNWWSLADIRLYV